ncbi:enoyl-CoA hydratase/isomerase family protein [Tianweitania sediminis]|uniref:Enoyl-CoA hydratase/isomerase family protein n=1 Tax=Tianweitania sediminis TaxID=1502156 RepID=A0A8J7UJE0_9HYPH|nr:enoyl-CoA hydratase/isomerase family protein [Tianweitania sediminis]MBP0439938.1 enoyl-CoA hydratase/isomerase family protein [Tianweitania sediminis]
MESQRILVRTQRLRHVLKITLDDPVTKNALSHELVHQLLGALNAIRDDRTIRAIVLRGANGAFCAGADLKSAFADLGSPAADGSNDPIYRANRKGGELFAAINSQPQTVIAVVDGPAYGGGFGMVCCADVVLCTTRARFALSETSLGIPPAQIAAYVVARLGQARARRLALTASRIDGRQAWQIGLADLVFDNADALEEALIGILNDIGRCAPGALAVTKDLILGDRDLPTQMMDRAAKAFTACIRSAEGAEGIAAFSEKRPAAWVEKLS